MSHVVRDALAVGVQIGQPALLRGAPGEGRSRAVEHAAEHLGGVCEVVVGSFRVMPDLAGPTARRGDSTSLATPRCAQRRPDRPDILRAQGGARPSPRSRNRARRAATTLVDLREPGWPAPSSAAAFAPVLRAAALV